MKPQQLFPLCRDAVMAWVDDFAPSMGAAISYYTMFSLAPLLVIVIAVAGLLFGQEAVQGQIATRRSRRRRPARAPRSSWCACRR
jgi:membrane protein